MYTNGGVAMLVIGIPPASSGKLLKKILSGVPGGPPSGTSKKQSTAEDAQEAGDAKVEVLFWVGCAGSYQDRAKRLCEKYDIDYEQARKEVQ